MSNAFFVPFNFQPVNTGRGNESSTYTVPSGKYARVTITLNIRAWMEELDNSLSPFQVNTSDDQRTLTIFMDEGEVLDFTTSLPTTDYPAAGSPTQLEDEAIFSITADIDGNAIAKAWAQVNFMVYSGGTITSSSIKPRGDAEAYFRYEEYNKIS